MKLVAIRRWTGLLWMLLLLLSGCGYQQQDLSSEKMGVQTRDSLTHLYERHYTYGSNWELALDSIALDQYPIKEAYTALHRGDRVVVAEFVIHPTDSIDSVWVKVAHSQEVQGWVNERVLKEAFVPTDSISQFIYLFSHTHASYFMIIFALFVGVYLFRLFKRKQLKLVYFNDIESFYPLMLCLLVATSAMLYESMQVFAPEMWEHFYCNPTLSPLRVPFVLALFLISIWLFGILMLVVLDELFKQLSTAVAVVYLLGLLSCCIFCYFFFILTTHIYIGYLFWLFFVMVFVQRIRRGKRYRYRCGQCGTKLRETGKCKRCGAMNI